MVTQRDDFMLQVNTQILQFWMPYFVFNYISKLTVRIQCSHKESTGENFRYRKQPGSFVT